MPAVGGRFLLSFCRERSLYGEGENWGGKKRRREEGEKEKKKRRKSDKK